MTISIAARRYHILILGIGGLSILVVLFRLTRFEFIVDTAQAASLWQCAVSMLFALAATVLRALRIHQIYHYPSARFLELFSCVAIAKVTGAVVPSDVSLYWVLRRSERIESFREFAHPWIILRALDAFILSLVFALTLPALPWMWQLNRNAHFCAAGICMLVVLVVLASITRLRRPKMIASSMAMLLKLARKIQMPAVVLAIAYWVLIILSAVVSVTAFKAELPWRGTILSASLAAAVCALPFRVPFGLGTTEAAWTFAMCMNGLPVERSVAIAIGIRLLSIVTLLTHAAVGFGIHAIVPRNGNSSHSVSAASKYLATAANNPPEQDRN